MVNSQPNSRQRQSRAIRNDERIGAAAVEVLGLRGWDGFALTSVATHAGLSKRPVADRFANREVLAAQVWRDQLGPHVAHSLTSVVAAASTSRTRALDTALEAFRTPNTVMRAATELMVVQQYVPRLRTQVNRTLQPVLTEVIEGAGRRDDSARNAYVVMLALGLLMAWPGSDTAVPSITPMVESIAGALALRLTPRRQPSRVARHLDGAYRFVSDEAGHDVDDVLSRIFQATLEQVGERGFEGATTLRIARAAGVSEGVIFNRYSTKMNLLLDASRRSVAWGAARNEEFMAAIELEYGAGMAEAVMLREVMRPGREVQRSINLEQQRLVRHHSDLRQSVTQQYNELIEAVRGTSSRWNTQALRGRVHVALAMGFGAALLAQLHPTSWALPYDVITEAAV